MDAGVIILPVAADGLAVQPLLSEPLRIVLPEQHSLGRRKSISLRELEGERFISVHRRQDPGFYTQVQSACEEQGLQTADRPRCDDDAGGAGNGGRRSWHCVQQGVLRAEQIARRCFSVY